jgi:hypothetical protein
MTTNEINTSTHQQIEEKLVGYFSLYTAEPKYSSALQKLLHDKSSQESLTKTKHRESRLIKNLRYQPVYRWIGVILFFILVLLALFAIQPVRAAIEHALGIGYLEEVGFIKESETAIFTGKIETIKPDLIITIDRVVANPRGTQIWFHVAGARYYPANINSEYFAYLDVNGTLMPLYGFRWSDDKQEGIFGFGPLYPIMSTFFILHISPDWTIPVHLIPMVERSNDQNTTIYTNNCQTREEVELCLRVVTSDANGNHLWLSALSKNPDFYLETLDIHNPLTGEDVNLVDSAGRQLTQIYPPQPPIPIEVASIQSGENPREVSTTLSFERLPDANNPMTLIVNGLTGKIPANETIRCELGGDPQVGDHFPCEKSTNIGGELIHFHEGEISQEADGIHLTLFSDPIVAVNGLLLTGMDLENLNLESSLWGNGFNQNTKQLELWKVVESINAKTSFEVKITAFNLTLLEPFRLSWSANP